MTTQAQTTLPRDISAVAYKNPFPVERMARATSSAANAPTTTPVIGQHMPDGTVYAGVSPDTGRAMYTTPKDTGLCDTWYKAMDYAAKLDAHGRKDWRVPTMRELTALFTNYAAIGGNFADAVHSDSGCYWSSSQHQYLVWARPFSDGSWRYSNRDTATSLRCVRG